MSTAILDYYVREISAIPLLTQEDEQRLARRASAGDQAASNALARANLRFVFHVARSYAHRGVPLEDLVNEGNIGLIRAIRRFDPDRGNRFITYAVWWIRQAIARAISEQAAQPPDAPLFGEEGEVSPGDEVADTGSAGPEEAALSGSMKEEIGALLETLPAREGKILKQRFGIDGSKPSSLEEIGGRLHMTRERVRQLERRALRRIRHSSGEKLHGYVA